LSYNSEILKTRHLRRVVAFYQGRKKSISETDFSGMLKNLSWSAGTSNVSPDPLSPTPTSSTMKTPKNTEEDPNDPEPADEEKTKWNAALISCMAQA
jgi:hypothetical protein